MPYTARIQAPSRSKHIYSHPPSIPCIDIWHETCFLHLGSRLFNARGDERWTKLRTSRLRASRGVQPPAGMAFQATSCGHADREHGVRRSFRWQKRLMTERRPDGRRDAISRSGSASGSVSNPSGEKGRDGRTSRKRPRYRSRPRWRYADLENFRSLKRSSNSHYETRRSPSITRIAGKEGGLIDSAPGICQTFTLASLCQTCFRLCSARVDRSRTSFEEKRFLIHRSAVASVPADG
jgi:hypothetical protein